MKARWTLAALTALSISTAVAVAQAPPQAVVPATPAAPATPPVPSPVSGIRNKISAGDLLSAESMLEVHKAQYGQDAEWLKGLSWLARGALLTGNTEKARQYAYDVRTVAAEKLAAGADLQKEPGLESALGAAIEVQAQLVAREKSLKLAAGYVRSELTRLQQGSPAFIARLNKRIDLYEMNGAKAPELVIEDSLGEPAPTLVSLRGKPVLLFLFAEWCGDCRAQAATLAQVKKRYAPKGLQVVGLTRYYDDKADRVREKARVDSVWKADYKDLGRVPIAFSTESMLRYGGSSTPTFVFIDKTGVVRRYTPTRLTEAEFDSTLSVLAP